MSDLPVSRREFQKTVALGGAAASVGGTAAAAASGTGQPAAAGRSPVQAEKPADPPAPPEEPRPLRIEEHLLEAVLIRYPSEQLTPEIQKSILSELRTDLYRSVVLSSFPLENAHEPAPVFAAWRSDLPELLQRDRQQRQAD
ncbi:MAG: hypothetical protein KDA79_15300 [Planctomycetaceae bacterium]|nr:hypothetical protein [Planctomycetaceae bacterium]